MIYAPVSSRINPALIRLNEEWLFMGMEPNHPRSTGGTTRVATAVWSWVTALAALVGLAPIVDASFSNSATYDEVTYLRVAAHWWRTGDQSEITRMGSPLTFWKLQQAPVLWCLIARTMAIGLTIRSAISKSFCLWPVWDRHGFGS